MRFLADECCHFAAVRSLRAAGHDVLAVNEFQHRSIDEDLMELALAENRIFLTEDNDFGWLVFAAKFESARSSLSEALMKLVHQHASQLAGSFPEAWYGSNRSRTP